MRILVRYTTFEFLKTFALTLSAITVFTLLLGVGVEAVKEGLSLGPVVRMMPFILPVTMRYSVPAAALLAACSLYGRMSGENEVVAVKSMGISPAAIMVPVFVSAFLISVVAVWINDVAVSWGRPGAQRIVSESIEQIAYGMLRTRRSFEMDGFSIIVKDVQDHLLIRPTITRRGDNSDDDIIVTAETAELRRNPESNSLSIFLTNGRFDGPRGFEGRFGGTIERVIELPNGRKNQRGELSPSDYAIRDLPAEREYQMQVVANLEGLMAAEAAFGLITGDIEGLHNLAWDERKEKRSYARYRINRLRTEPWRRWANGFSCFFFVLVGVPLSIRMRHSDFVTSFFATFLPILLVYYPLMTYGVDRAKDGTLPQYACWLGNAACLLWGGWLLRRVMRH
jgi:lipopolysaccharide export system permease protein